MPRRLFNKLNRQRDALKDRWFLRPFSALLHDPALWSTHRRSVLRALALGVFIGCLPLPFHMAIAAAIALYLRINVVVAVLATWVSNPLTITPLFLAEYYLGTWLLDTPAQPFDVELTLDWLLHGLSRVWKPLLTGALVTGAVSAGLAYFLLDRIWRISLVYRFRRRRGARRRDMTRPA